MGSRLLREMIAGVADQGQSGSIARVLRILARNKDLRRVELAFATFNVAEWGTWLAMLVYAYAHGGVTAAGVLATAMLVPAAICAPPLAAFGERHAPGRVLAAGYLGQAVSCAVVAVAMLAGSPRLVVYALLTLPSVAFTVTRPTQSAFAPGLARLPEELAATNVVSSWIEGLSTLGGPLLVGVVLTVSTPGVLFAVGAAICAAAAFLVLPARDAMAAPVGGGEDAASEPPSLGGSFAFVRRDPNARTLVLLLGAQAVALGALDILYVELARGVLHLGGNWAGYLNAAFGLGSVLAIGLTARLVGHPRLARPLVLSLAVWTVALFGLASTPALVLSLLFIATAGGARSIFDVGARTLLQRVARPDLLARVLGLLEGLEMAGLAVGSLLATALFALGGAGVAFAGVALLLPLVALSSGRRLLDVDRHATAPVVEIALLRSVPMLSLLPPPTLESLARALTPEEVPTGVEVVTQGDEGDRFYVIADGELEVIADDTMVATLQRGDGFGEIALMYDVPRTATVRTCTDARLYSLEREDFLVAVTGHLPAQTLAQGLASERLAQLESQRASRSAASAD
jgi:Cyclic nucleotide-binding domain/Major Facilitator Superfamily